MAWCSSCLGLLLVCVGRAVRSVQARVMRWASIRPRPGADGKCQACARRGALLETHAHDDLMTLVRGAGLEGDL